jgi:hypothetical protein
MYAVRLVGAEVSSTRCEGPAGAPPRRRERRDRFAGLAGFSRDSVLGAAGRGPRRGCCCWLLLLAWCRRGELSRDGAAWWAEESSRYGVS